MQLQEQEKSVVWPKTSELGSLLQGDLHFQLRSQTPLLYFSVNYTYHSHTQDAETVDWVRNWSPLNRGCDFQRQRAGYGIGNMSSFFEPSLSPGRAGYSEMGRRPNIKAEDQSWNRSGFLWHLEFKISCLHLMSSCFLTCKAGIVKSAPRNILIKKMLKDFVNFKGLAPMKGGEVIIKADCVSLRVVKTFREWYTS